MDTRHSKATNRMGRDMTDQDQSARPREAREFWFYGNGSRYRPRIFSRRLKSEVIDEFGLRYFVPAENLWCEFKEEIQLVPKSDYDQLSAQLTEANRRLAESERKLAIAREFVEQMHEQGILLGIKSDEDDETIGLDPDEVAQRANVVLRKISA